MQQIRPVTVMCQVGKCPPAKGTNGTQGSMNIGNPVVFGLRALFLVMELQPQSLRIKEKIL